MKKIFILGIGRNTGTIIDLALDCGYEIEGLLHYNHDRIGEKCWGLEIIGCFEDFISRDCLTGQNFALSMGDISIKKRIFEKITGKGGNIPSLIHPSCIISKFSNIGKGALIMPGSIVQADSSVGNNTCITVNSVIAHSASVGSHCLISGLTMVGAYTSVGDCSHIGQGATIVSGKGSVGNYCILGAGSTLISKMEDNSIYVGNPAKFLKNNVLK